MSETARHAEKQITAIVAHLTLLRLLSSSGVNRLSLCRSVCPSHAGFEVDPSHNMHGRHDLHVKWAVHPLLIGISDTLGQCAVIYYLIYLFASYLNVDWGSAWSAAAERRGNAAEFQPDGSSFSLAKRPTAAVHSGNDESPWRKSFLHFIFQARDRLKQEKALD